MKAKGVTKTAFAKLEKLFPYTRPGEKDTLEKIQRREGMEDVMSYIRRNLVDD
jgi:hypothetical protein